MFESRGRSDSINHSLPERDGKQKPVFTTEEATLSNLANRQFLRDIRSRNPGRSNAVLRENSYRVAAVNAIE